MTSTLATVSRVTVAGVALCLSGACSMRRAPAPPMLRPGVVYYLDGAGGGGPITDWGRGIKRGLDEAAYDGDFHNYKWQSGLGALVDQRMSVEQKRSKAAGLARMIRAYIDEHPARQVDLVGLSAGSAIAVFALEALPRAYSVETVVLLGSSVSAEYDLTAALRRVRRGVFVFTSDRDAVLRMLVPLSGTADGKRAGRKIAGLRGFRMPAGASDETQALYSKVTNVRWEPGVAAAGEGAGHTGATRPRFVRRYIAPLLVREGPRYLRVHLAPADVSDPAGIGAGDPGSDSRDGKIDAGPNEPGVK